MIQILEGAQRHFRKLIEDQDLPGLGVRLSAEHPGTVRADCRLEFCEPADLSGDEWAIDCDGFTLYVESGSLPYLDAAEIDYVNDATGGQLAIKAPNLKLREPDADASLPERLRHLIEVEINPSLASHGGRVALEELRSDGAVVLRFGGGCQGCGMVGTTLREGIERTLRERFPEITAVLDATDHASGSAPYYRG